MGDSIEDDISVCVSDVHRFGTDAFLLADFASPREKDRVCDLGTGCGIIPLIMCKRFSPKTIFGVDIQEMAIEQFKRSIEISKASLKTELFPVLSDLNCLPYGEKSSQLQKGSFDVVTCNPPYKASNAGILSEHTAECIARHEVMCTIDDVCKAASELLKFSGRLLICQRPERLADVIVSMKKHNIEPKRLRFVAKHHSTAPWLFLIEGKKGSRPFMRVMPSFAMYIDGTNIPTDDLKSVYGNQYSIEGND